MEDLSSNVKTHKISLQNRKSCTMCGVKDVKAFDLNEILLVTEAGHLTIKGQNLHIGRLTLDRGEVDIDGKIDSLVYADHGGPEKGESLLARWFR